MTLYERSDLDAERWRFLESAGVGVIEGQEVLSVDSGRTVTARGSRSRFDSVVISTGSGRRYSRFKGSSKRGVFFADMSDALSPRPPIVAGGRALVVGEGLPALRAADSLCSLGSQVTVLSRGPRGWPRLQEAVEAALVTRAASLGVKFLSGEADIAAGTSEVRCVVTEGRVVPCEAVLVLPRLVPHHPLVEARTGERGGILVDSRQASTCPGVYSAGSCSLQVGSSSVPGPHHSAGKVAGCNAAGGSLLSGPPPSTRERLFGVEVTSAGFTLRESLTAGLDADFGAATRGTSQACSIVYERRSLRVLGAQMAGGEPDQHSTLLLAVAQSMPLEALAGLDSGPSTDMSLIAEAVRRCLGWKA